MRYDLGSGPSVLVSSQPVELGSWHKLVFRRYHQDGMLQIDKSDPVRGKASGRNKSLNIKGRIYIGGHPHVNRTGDMVDISKGLQGCVKDLKIRRKSIGLGKGVESSGVVSCSSHPCGEGYCKNEGQCRVKEARMEAVCSCGQGFRGKRCHKRKKSKKKATDKRKKEKKRNKNRTLHLIENKQKSKKRIRMGKRQRYPM